MTASVAQARERARTILAEFGVKAAPVPVERIIKARNIALQYAPLEESLSGMAYIKDGVGIIGVNALHHPNRQRFSAAHELAHHMLHPEELEKAVHIDSGLRVLFRDEVSAQGTDALEVEANAFAAELLMPRDLLVAALDGGGIDMDDDAAVEALARKFRVSASAMRYRLANGL